MSTTVVVLEIAGITAAAVGMVLAGSPPGDLRAWWDRQGWLQELIMPGAGQPAGERGLTILPWNGDTQNTAPEPAAGSAEPAAGAAAGSEWSGPTETAEPAAPEPSVREAATPEREVPSPSAGRWRPTGFGASAWDEDEEALEGVVLEPGYPSPADHLPPYGTSSR